MKPRVTVLTLGISDLERSVKFYRDGLGLPTKGIVGTEFEHGAVAFFNMQNGIVLALWPMNSLQHDSGVPQSQPSCVSIGHNVNSRNEVDEAMAQAKSASARIVKPAHTFWGG